MLANDIEFRGGEEREKSRRWLDIRTPLPGRPRQKPSDPGDDAPCQSIKIRHRSVHVLVKQSANEG